MTHAVTAEQLRLLNDIECGAVFNTTHTSARELIDAGLAYADWGQLVVSEAGRIILRHAPRGYRITSEHVSDLAEAHIRAGIDPMTAPHLVEAARPGVIPVTLPETKPVPVSPPGDSRTRGLRAAGVASGACDEWPSAAWVDAFIEAWDDAAE